MKPRIYVFVGLALAIALGFVREFVFENINTHLYFLRQEEVNPYLPQILNFLTNWSFNELYYTKYPLMVAFVGINMLLCICTWRRLFPNIPVQQRTIMAYTALFGVGALIFLIGFPFDAEHTTYAITRQLIEPLQSPLGILILGVAFFVQRKFAQ